LKENRPSICTGSPTTLGEKKKERKKEEEEETLNAY